MPHQRTFDFDRPPEPTGAAHQRAPDPVPTDSSLPPPPPLVRPDRQLVYPDAGTHYDWPDPKGLHDHDTITVDRISDDIDGPAHRFVIKRGDTVEVYVGHSNFALGTVTGISHAREEVRVSLRKGHKGGWYYKGKVYPAPEPEAQQRRREPPKAKLSAIIGEVNAGSAPADSWQETDAVPREVAPRDVLSFLDGSPGTEFTAGELRREFGRTDFDPQEPLKNAVHRALAALRERGRIHVEEPRFGEARFSVLALPDSPSAVTLECCPEFLSGPEVRRLLRKGGWTVRAFAERWGFCQKHVREVFDRGLSDRNSVRDWIEAVLTDPSAKSSSSAGGEPAGVVEPPSDAATEPPPYTFGEFKELWKLGCRHESFAAYRADFERVACSRDALLAELLSAYKAPVLRNIAANLGNFSAKCNTKEENAKSIYRKMLASFLLDGVVSYGMTESFEDAVAKKVRAVTEADWNAHVERQARRQIEREEALADPQTLADFRAFVEARGEKELTSEQLARWDALCADLARERRAASGPSATVTQFESGEAYQVAFTIKQGYHEKRGCPLWIVQLGARVEKEAYRELLSKAKQLGGWYSSFKKEDAGFQFLSEEAATRFTGLLSGDANGEDILAARKERKEQSASERLHELAAEMLRRSEEAVERSHTSLQNTERRAGIHAGVRGRAYAEAALARSLHSVADALSRGEAKYLDGIRHRTHLEELDRTLTLARWARLRAIRMAQGESEYGHSLRVDDEEAKPLSEEDLRFAAYPYPSVYARTLKELVSEGRNRRGLKQVSAKLAKRLPRFPEQSDFVAFEHDYELGLLRDFVSRAKAAGLDCSRVADELAHYERLQRAGVSDIHQLRAALREYLPHKASVRGDDPVRVAERELIGKDLPGFFPTPQPVIDRMLELAEIEPGHAVLEPSCGKGDIVLAIRREHPQSPVTAVEKNLTLAEVLAAKSIDAEFTDFLQHTGVYDRIVMNPPFAKGADIEHVRHAYGRLAPGGRLVSVMSDGPFFRSDGKAVAFREWFTELGGESHELPEDAFNGADSFRQTGVRTRLLVMHRGDDR